MAQAFGATSLASLTIGQGATIGAVTGAMQGFGMGMVTGWAGGKGDARDMLESGISGGLWGAATGAVIGAASVAIAKGMESSRQASQIVAEKTESALEINKAPVGNSGGGGTASSSTSEVSMFEYDARGYSYSTGEPVPSKQIVIGETMDRVIVKAKEIGASYYVPRNALPPNPTKADISRALRNNYQWLRHKYNNNYEVVDIGVDPNRPTRSIFYAAEKKWWSIWNGD